MNEINETNKLERAITERRSTVQLIYLIVVVLKQSQNTW